MLSVEQALALVLAEARSREPASVPSVDALGLVLAEDVHSDIDSPPHDKSIVDGYAVVAADLAQRPRELTVLEEITAGKVPGRAVTPGHTTRIMTGAPLPEGADAVIMVEQSELVQPAGSGTAEVVRLAPRAVSSGQNILRRGASMRRGDRVLESGHLLRPSELGLLAEVGKSQILAIPRPRLAVLATGDELVPANELPGPGHIRNSNSPMLVAAGRAAGADSYDLGIAPDEAGSLRALISEGLGADVLVLSGGVSAGVLDLVPQALESLGVEPVLHKIRMKPGKPLWFGVKRASDGGQATLVFGLPGNPVSSLVGFELFVKPALARLAGRQPSGRVVPATLSAEFSHRGDRPTYHPGVLREAAEGNVVEPLRWQGSADLRTLAGASALICFEAGDYTLERGASVRALPLE